MHGHCLSGLLIGIPTVDSPIVLLLCGLNLAPISLQSGLPHSTCDGSAGLGANRLLLSCGLLLRVQKHGTLKKYLSNFPDSIQISWESRPFQHR